MADLFRLAAQEFDPAIDVTSVSEHPENYNHGDMGAIEESMIAHGFFGGVLVQRSTRLIVAGNHRYRQAVKLGATTVPGFWLDVDDDEARRLLAVDNRTGKLAEPDESLLASLLQSLASTPAGLTGTGYNAADLALLLADFEPTGEPPPPLDEVTPKLCQRCGYDVANNPERLG